MRCRYKDDFYYFPQKHLASPRASKAQEDPYHFIDTHNIFFAKRFLEDVGCFGSIDFT